MSNTLQNTDDEEDFNWLKRACRGKFPTCSIEWGENGYTGCSNHGGELLYLSRPSKSKGLIMARGHFATSLYASLSRSQIDFGGPSTFGLEVAKFPYPYDPDGKVITQEEMIKQKESTRKDVLGAKNGSSFCLGSMIDRGCFNYRWSVTEYYLDLHPNQEIIEIAKKKKREASQGIQGTKESEGNGKTQSTS